MALSDDEASEDGELRRPRVRGKSKKHEAHAKGTKAREAYVPPIPGDWKELEPVEPNGPKMYQQYKLPAGTLVFKRRQFDFSKEDLKLGLPVQQRPAPPEIFSDSFLFRLAKSKLSKLDVDVLEKLQKLQRRVERRIILLYFNYFQGMSVQPGGNDLDLLTAKTKSANAQLEKVFHTAYPAPGWTEKQVMAWAMPEIVLISKEAQHYAASGEIRSLNYVTERVLSIYLLGRPDLYMELTGQTNRLEQLEAPLMSAAKILNEVVLDGVLVRNGPGKWKARPNLKLLFNSITTRYGKSHTNLDTDGFQEGDVLVINIFEHLNLSETIQRDGKSIKLDAQATHLHNLTESALCKGLMLLEKTLPTKKRSHPTSKATRARRNVRTKKQHFSKPYLAALDAWKHLLSRKPVSVLQALLSGEGDASDAVLNGPDKQDKDVLIKVLLQATNERAYVDKSYSAPEAAGEEQEDEEGGGEEGEEGEEGE